MTIPEAPRHASPGKVQLASRRLDFVDGLRGVACLYVVLYHLFLLWPVSSHGANGDILPIQILTRFAAYGHIGVDVFLVLSGFCLFYPVSRRALAGATSVAPISVRSYAVRRARRILPPYFVTLGIFSVLPVWTLWSSAVQPLPTIPELISHIGLVHNLFPSTILRIDGPLWSLALEAQLYIVFPLLVLAFRKFGATRFALGLLLASLAFRTLAWGPAGISSAQLEMQFVAMASLPGRVFEFGAGMIAAYIISRQHAPRRRVWLGWTALLVAVLSATIAYAADKQFGEHSPIPSLAWGLMACGLLVATGSGAVRPLEALLNWRPIVNAGLVSYSIYLIHEPLLRLTGVVVAQLNLQPLIDLILFLLVGAPVLLGVSVIFWLLVERPCLGASRGSSTAMGESADRSLTKAEVAPRLATADLN